MTGAIGRSTAMLVAVLAAGAANAAGQTTRPCDEDWGGDRPRFCEVRELTLPARASVEVDAGPNGGVQVEGWDDGGIRIEARVQAQASSEQGARQLASAVRVLTDGTIHAEGPATDRDDHTSWSVSYHVYVPRRTNLSLQTRNGGIGISGVSGTLRFDAVNGGVRLAGLGGDVRGATRNGGLDVRLTGSRWEGSGLDVQTTNGGVTMAVPAGYNAHLETGTVNGGMTVDFPVTMQGRIGRTLSADLGRGGAALHVRTTNGGVRIRRVEAGG